MAISLIFDKSAFQLLNKDEVVLLHKYFLVNIPPVLVMEIIGDLKKEVKDEEINIDEVIKLAKKTHPFNSHVNTHYIHLIEGELLGKQKVEFYRPIINTAELVEMANGKRGYRIHKSDEEIAIDRWKEGNFLETDRILSQTWREITLQKDILTNVKEYFKDLFIFEGLKTQKDILNVFDLFFNKPNFQAVCLELFIQEFSISPEKASQIFYRWETTSEKNLLSFAPYSLFCLRARFLFYILLRNNIISDFPTNWVDLNYVYYLPFCRVFLSNDKKLHDKIVPFLINQNQLYINGEQMKKELQQIIEIKKHLTGKELIRTEQEPPRNPELLIYQIWNQMLVGWPPEKDWEPSPEEFKMMNDMITQFRNAKPVKEV